MRILVKLIIGIFFIAITKVVLAAPYEVIFSQYGYSFGDVQIGGSASKIVTITNVGTESLTFESGYPVLSNNNEYSMLTTCGSGLAAGASCDFTIKFSPTRVGSSSTSILVPFVEINYYTTSGFNGKGVGTETYELSFTPYSDSVGTIQLGESVSKTFTLKNSGTGDATFLYGYPMLSQDGADYSMTTTCKNVIMSGDSCDVVMTYSPQRAGYNVGSIEARFIETTDYASAYMSGATADNQYNISISPSSYKFQNLEIGGSQTQNFVLSNTGTADMIFKPGSPLVGGADGSYGVVSSSCGVGLVVGASCEILVRYSPTKIATSFNIGSLWIWVEETTKQFHAQLEGGTQGAYQYVLEIEPSNYDFGEIVFGDSVSHQFIIKNKSAGVVDFNEGMPKLVYDSPSDSEFIVQETDCKKSLSAFSVCTMNVKFSPQKLGVKSVKLMATISQSLKEYSALLLGAGKAVVDPPAITSVKSGNQQITVFFADNVRSSMNLAIKNANSYTASCTSSNGGMTGEQSGSSSPIIVGGLTNGKSYTCTVTTSNDGGTSAPSAASATVIPTIQPPALNSIPTLSEWAKIVMAFAMFAMMRWHLIKARG